MFDRFGEAIRDRTSTLLDRNNLAPVPSFIPFGAPIFNGLRAAREVVSRPAGPVPDLLSTALILPRSRRAERCVSLADLPTVINCGQNCLTEHDNSPTLWVPLLALIST
jgi:hypothetical protein